MRLVSVRTSRVIEGPSEAGSALQLRPHWCAVALETDSGLTGTGFVPLECAPLVERIARELLDGEDPRGVTGLWQRMVDATSASPYAAGASAAIAALDLALWDLKAQANGDPLWRALGASRPRINVHARVPDHIGDATFDTALSELASEHGFRGACLAASDDAARDARRLASVRDALAANTDAPALMLDLDERFTPKDAERRIRSLESKCDLTWVEAPASSTDCAGLKRVSDAICAAVCGGRRLGAPRDFLPHFRARSLDVVQLGFQTAGITGALQVADTAFGFELPIALTAAPGNLNAHLAAALPLCMSLEVDDAGVNRIASSDVQIAGGWAIAGDRPGHGVLVDGASFERKPVRASSTRDAAARPARVRARTHKR